MKRMGKPQSSKARQIAQAAILFEQRSTGRLPRSITVVLGEGTVVITLRESFSRAETALAKSSDGAAQLREFHRQLFNTSSRPLRQEIQRIVGVDVLGATAEVEMATGTVVQVFSLVRAVPADTWSGSAPDLTDTELQA